MVSDRGIIGIILLPGQISYCQLWVVVMSMLSESEIRSSCLLEAKSTFVSTSELRKMFIDGCAQISLSFLLNLLI